MPRPDNVLSLASAQARLRRRRGLPTITAMTEPQSATFSDDWDAPKHLITPWLHQRAKSAAELLQSAREWAGVHSTFTLGLTASLALLATAAFIYWELQTSGIEAHYVTELAPDLTYRLETGVNTSLTSTARGPYDLQLGYARLSEFAQAMEKQGYEVEAQARLSPLHQSLVEKGLFPAFQEKSAAGLRVAAADDATLFEERYPKVRYAAFQDVPSLVVTSLLFIEDRQVLDDSRKESLNPAIAWDRLTKATVELLLDKLLSSRNVPGGSTLATQIEKFRHSTGGRTHDSKDKLRQMASATARAYLLGRDTRQTREQIVLDYINGVPLGAVPGLGEVNGLAAGLEAWYGTDLETVTKYLTMHPQRYDLPARATQAKAFKRVLALFLAQRRPAYYLQRNQAALTKLANTHIRLMANTGVIAKDLARDALKENLDLLPPHTQRQGPEAPVFTELKAANAVRFELQQLLGLKSLYELDRLDLDVKSTFNRSLQTGVSNYLAALRTPEGAMRAGVVGERMLRTDQAPMVNYSFTLIERQDDHNVVRVQSDTVNSPLDLNRGGKLELGSTAKLRTLITYLELVAEGFQRYEPHLADKAWLEAQMAETSDQDTLTEWLLTYLQDEGPKATLTSTLKAAMSRPFSASPYEGFFTGGGLMHFSNYEKDDNRLHLSVTEAFQRSNNLVFVRVMKEIVQRVVYTQIPGAKKILENVDDARRSTYLNAFVETESADFLRRFHKQLSPLSSAERLERLQGEKHLTSTRLAALLLTIRPDLDYYAFHLLMTKTFPKLAENALIRYWKTIHPSVMSLNDRAYVARLHPLAIWTAAFLEANPKANLKEALVASHAARLESYAWLYKKAGRRRQNKDIWTMLEREAFQKHIVGYWQRQGFPFDKMAPSYASALGSSGDRPSALADLVGAIFNAGVLMPTKRIEEIRLGKSTPYETSFTPSWTGARRAVTPEVAEAAKAALRSVVDGGTARRLKGVIKRSDGTEIEVAAKTGTGDNRFETYGPGGRVISSEAKSRTATLVFAIGERFYGTITAYVKADDGSADVDDFRFTSALVVQALKSLMPTLQPAVLRVEDPWAFAIN